MITDCQNRPYIGRQTTESEGREDPERIGLTSSYVRRDLKEIGLSWEEAQLKRALPGQRRSASMCGSMCPRHRMTQDKTRQGKACLN